jgi:hypothetical protein
MVNFFELPLISQVLHHLVYVAIATRTNANQEYLWINGSMIDSLTIEDSSSFVESVLHCDTTQDEKKSATPGSTFTYILNVLGETPVDVGSVARKHNKGKSCKKLQSFYLQPGDANVFSDRQFHRTGRPSTFPYPDNMRIHFLCANNADDASGRYLLVLPPSIGTICTTSWNNSELSFKTRNLYCLNRYCCLGMKIYWRFIVRYTFWYYSIEN